MAAKNCEANWEQSMAGELAGKVAIVTGGCSGLGRATVDLFLKEGAKVVIADVTASGEELARSLGTSALFKQTDVANPDQVQALVDFAVARFGGLNVMFNNAGIGGAMYERFLDDDLRDFHRVMDVNLLGVMLGTQRAARHMVKNGGGSIINTSSMGGVKCGFGVMTYRAAKAGIVHFTKSVAIDLAEYSVRVNCLAPGLIRTGMTSYTSPDMSPEVAERVKLAVGPAAAAARPLKREGMPGDVANAALYLASDRSIYMTGVIMPVDGGATAGDAINHVREIMSARAKAIAGT
jgi:NAD(P)-dependent dehydrogenase (short-subunit alcohol dehydrogenase family)